VMLVVMLIGFTMFRQVFWGASGSGAEPPTG